MRTVADGIRTFMSSAFCSRSLRNTRTLLSPEVPSIMPFALGTSEVSENTAPTGISVSRDPFSALSIPRSALLIRYALIDSVKFPHPSNGEDAFPVGLFPNRDREGVTRACSPPKIMKTPSGADPLVRAGPPGPALRVLSISSRGRRGRRPRTRGSAPLDVFKGALPRSCGHRILHTLPCGRGSVLFQNPSSPMDPSPSRYRSRL
jgi:hypothetical protein